MRTLIIGAQYTSGELLEKRPAALKSGELELREHADLKRYAAKRAGENRYAL